jgi:hypothetical protein
MIPSIERIEMAIMNHRDFNFRQNLMVFRVTDFSGVVNHECDCLIMSKAGYLTEIEIKRSYTDFMADFKKNHSHDDNKIQRFLFLVHVSFAEKVFKSLSEKKRIPSAIYTYDDDCKIKIAYTKDNFKEIVEEERIYYANAWGARKLFLEEQYQLARLGAMRYKNMTEKLIKSKNLI